MENNRKNVVLTRMLISRTVKVAEPTPLTKEQIKENIKTTNCCYDSLYFKKVLYETNKLILLEEDKLTTYNKDFQELNFIQKEAVFKCLTILGFDPDNDKSYINFIKSWEYYA